MANEQLLYFTSSSLSADDSVLFYLSDEGGNPNIWRKDLITGEIVQLSDNHEGVLKSYVYFRGQPYRGLGKASVSLDANHETVYYIQGCDILAANINGIRKIATLPKGQMTAFTHVSADGRYLCVPTTDERALEDEDGLPLTQDGCGNLNHDIDARVQAEGLCSYLRVFDLHSGDQILCERVERAWITHVQFSPTDSSAILYNHEWPSDCGIRRMWLYKDGKHKRLRTAENGREKGDWTCHEMWCPDGEHIIYHGCYANGGFYIGRVTTRGDDNVEIRLPEEYKAYGHFTMGHQHPDWLVTDGYYTADGKSDYICVSRVNWDTGDIDWQPLCHHESLWTTQDTHPHPIFDHGDNFVYFTGHQNGTLCVRRAAVDK